MISVVAIGKRHEPWIVDGIKRYQERLRGPWKIEWILLPHSTYEGIRARQEESARILAHLKPHDIVILLDERGKNLSSEEVSLLVTSCIERAMHVVVIIGGAYGVNKELYERAQHVWSLSRLVFPHQLVRLILVEQLYRAQEVSLGHPYHHM